MRNSRYCVAFLAAIATALLAAGCGGSSSTSNSAASTSSEAPHRGGNLIFARAYEPITFDPLKTEGDNGSLWDMMQIYDQLVEYRPGTYNVQPGLASSWTISPNGLRYTFKLRKARFSNGEPVTAQDVKFSVDRFASPKTDAAYAEFLAAEFKSSSAPNPETFVIELKKPDAGFLAALAVPVASIVPQAVVEREGSEFSSHPVGSGPFMLASWVRGQYVKLVRNPYYWRTGLPYLNSVTINYVPNDNTRVLQVTSGQADVAESIPYTQVSELSAQPDVSVQSAPIVAYDAIWLNDSYGPLSEVKVRQALNYALNKQAINQSVYAGKAEVNNSTLAQTKFWSSKVSAYAYDVAKAKELMAASKYPKGFSLSLKVPAGDTVYGALALIAKEEWSQIGVNVTIEPVETNTLFSEYSSGNYQAAIPQPATTSDVLVPEELALAWLVYTPSYQSYFTQYKDPAVESLVLQADRSTSEAEQAKLWPEIQEKSLADAPWVPVVFPPELTAVRSNVAHFQTLRTGWWELAETWLR
ncbi:MAG TPA: ABC transporter substrate-binding protein [Solirubrobacteraceae bacterium]|jgi:peptide/nickel transport system substrate-binding protein|nr:ABC transporter substrate-binding protein [Solirubrobacteraceae bacterium]